MAPAERGRLGHWRQMVVSPARGCVLEIGTGTGLNFEHYGAAASVIATDVDVAMLRRAIPRAKTAASSILLVAADAEALPFPDGTFDEAVVGLAMCTIPHPERALAELRRAVVRGGTVRLLEHVRMDDSPVLGRLQDWVTPVWRRVAGGCRLNRRTVNTVRETGFVVESVEPHMGGYMQSIVARAPGVDFEAGSATGVSE